jgi:D-inositol-3-phosphate glycosyltransferase
LLERANRARRTAQARFEQSKEQGASMPGRIAMISEHASPLAQMGSVDAGGQNVYVANTAKQLAALGYEVDIFTRRDDEALPSVVRWQPNIRIIHIEAGPPRFVRKEELLPAMGPFADRVLDIARRAEVGGNGYLLSHAHFFMSGLIARRLKDELALPYVVTFHALGRVRLMHHGSDDFPRERGLLEEMVMEEADAVIAECPQDALDLCTHMRASRVASRSFPADSTRTSSSTSTARRRARTSRSIRTAR